MKMAETWGCVGSCLPPSQVKLLLGCRAPSRVSGLAPAHFRHQHRCGSGGEKYTPGTFGTFYLTFWGVRRRESEKWKRENQHGHCTSGKLQGSHPRHQQHSSSANPFLDQEQAERRFLLPPAAAFLGGVPEGGADMLESCCVTEQHFVRAPAAMAKLGHSWWEPGN